MMKSGIFIALLIVLLSCSNQIPITNNYDGTWAESDEENALFIISGDSIKNVEHGDKMYFQIQGDTMAIDYGDSTMKYFVVKSSVDSLILRNPDNSITRLYKRRK